MTTDKKDQRRKKIQKIKDIPKNLFLGEVMTSSLLYRYKFTILIVMTMLLLYISIKYKCMTSMEKINNLEIELATIKSESIRQQSTYMSNTRESIVQQMIEDMNLDLSVQKQPPYVLHY